jgi:hypothetical protein
MRKLFVNRLTKLLIAADLLAITGTIQAAPCPCDIYQAAGTPCVSAHSTVRALYETFDGPLYQVRRTSDNALKDIPLKSKGGYINMAIQDSFLNGKAGTISIIYDQSPNKNHLEKAPKAVWLKNGGTESKTSEGKHKVNGYPVNGIYVTGYGPDVGYRNITTKGVPVKDEAESMYMVVDGKRSSDQCCFNYGNVGKTSTDEGNGTMECIYWGKDITWGGKGEGSGPWVAADLENGVYKSDKGGWQSQNILTPSAKSIVANYATCLLKGYSGNRFVLKGGDAQTGKLITMWDGARPNKTGYSPKQLQGCIVLGTGGDGSNGGTGTFFEGAITKGVPPDSIDDKVQENIRNAGYGLTTTPVVLVCEVGNKSGLNACLNLLPNSAAINYTLQSASQISITVFDQQGRQISQIVNSHKTTGQHQTVWDTRQVPPGVYAVNLSVNGHLSWSGKIVKSK